MSLTKAHSRITKQSFTFVDNITDLKAISEFDNNVHVIQKDIENASPGLYYWDNASLEVDDDIEIVKSNHHENGRWKRSLLSPSIVDAIDGDSSHDTIPTTLAVKEYVDAYKLPTSTVTIPTQATYDDSSHADQQFSIISDTYYYINTDDDWITVVETNGLLSTTVNYSINSNNTINPRTGQITITTSDGYEYFTVNQLGIPKYLTFNDGNPLPEAHGDGEEISVSIQTNITNWAASLEANLFASITSDNTGDGDGQLTIQLTENPSTTTDRSVVLTVQDIDGFSENITITQKASTAEGSVKSMEVTIDTNLDGLTVELNYVDNVIVHWGEVGVAEEYYEGEGLAYSSDIMSHTYTQHGIYTIWIKQGSARDDCNFAFGNTLGGGGSSSTLGGENLTAVVNWGIMKRTSLISLFAGCKNLGTLPDGDVPSTFDITECTALNSTFRDCESLQAMPYIELSGTNIISLADCWRGCTTLTQFPLLDTTNVVILDRTWYGCSGLTGTFPSIITTNATSFVQTWQNCSSLTGTFPDLDYNLGLDFRYTWSGCSLIAAFPASLSFSEGTQFNNCWVSCTSLTTFPDISVPKATTIAGAWSGCTNIQSFGTLTISNDLTNIGATWKNCSSLINSPNISVANIITANDAWSGCTSLESFPSDFTTALTGLKLAWFNCSSLTGTFPSIITTNVSDLQQTWDRCSGLTGFPSIDTSSATTLRYTWNSCSSLTGTFPSITTNLVEDFERAWYGCSGLTGFSSINISSATNLKRAWYGCTLLSSFSKFSNTSYTKCEYDQTWYDCTSLNITPTSNNPFEDATTVPLADNKIFNVYKVFGTNVSTTYYPPFDISNASKIIIGADDIVAPGDFNVTGWDQITFPLINDPSYDNNEETVIHINLNIGETEYDSILNALASNISNHTTGTYIANFNQNTNTAASATAMTTLINAGWTITDGNTPE